MNATPTTAQPVSATEISTSCRVPLFVLFVSAAVWLVVASVLGMLGSMTFHAPDMFANCPALSFGRVHPAATNAFLYGFVIQAGLGVSLWLLAQTGETKVVQPWVIAFAGKLLNIGVALGLIGIFIGDSTGFENLEMPHYGGWFVWLGILVITICSLFTLHARRERSLGPVQWFLLAAMFWLPWIFSTARLLLVWWPARGVVQSLIAWWFSANFTYVWLSLIGLATAFHFIPKLMSKPLQSRELVIFAFWTLLLFGTWTGIPSSAPVPVWMPTLSSLATMLTIIPVLGVALMVFQTCGRGCEGKQNPPPGKFFAFAAMMFLVAGVARALTGLPEVSAVTNFTWFNVAQSQLFTYGFFSMVMFGAIYLIVPQVTGIEWPFAGLVRVHFWLAAIGMLLFAIPLAIGGVVQGLKLNNPTIPFLDIAKATLMYFRISTLGELFILLGHVLLAGNLAVLSLRYYKTHFVPTYESMLVEPEEVEI
jgi:cytochrome c oxidase cbb3-type subunit 1